MDSETLVLNNGTILAYSLHPTGEVFSDLHVATVACASPSYCNTCYGKNPAGTVANAAPEAYSEEVRRAVELRLAGAKAKAAWFRPIWNLTKTFVKQACLEGTVKDLCDALCNTLNLMGQR